MAAGGVCECRFGELNRTLIMFLICVAEQLSQTSLEQKASISINLDQKV